MASDNEIVEEELDISSPEVLTKYKSAAAIVNDALRFVLSQCKPDVKIVDLCEKGDSYILEKTSNIYSNVKKKIERGIAFPTCLSVNHTIGHVSPLASDETVLKEGDILKIDMGCHIDGFIAVVAHTHVLHFGPVTGRMADVIAAANTAAEVALRLVRPGKKSQDVTEAIQKVAAAYDCRIVEGVVSHQLKQFAIDGNKFVLSVANPDTRVDDAEFEENEVYAIDIVTSTGDGKPKLLDENQTTIYKRAVDKKYQLKIETSQLISEISQKFPIMPFSARSLEAKHALIGLAECVNHELLQPYPVLHEKPGDLVARIKFTVLLMPNGSDRITSYSLQELLPTKNVDDPEVKAWLALPVKSKKKGGGKKKKEAKMGEPLKLEGNPDIGGRVEGVHGVARGVRLAGGLRGVRLAGGLRGVRFAGGVSGFRRGPTTARAIPMHVAEFGIGENTIGCLKLTMRLGLLTFFYGSAIALMSHTTSAAEHLPKKFIEKHWAILKAGSWLVVIGFLSACTYVALLGLNLLAAHLHHFFGFLAYGLGYSGLAIWTVSVYTYGSNALIITLWVIMILVPLLGGIGYCLYDTFKSPFTSEEKKFIAAINPTMKKIQSMLIWYEDYATLDAEDERIIAEVFKHHPRPAEKLHGSQVDSFTVGPHGVSDNDRSFYVVSQTGWMEEFSYMACAQHYIKKRFEKEADTFWDKYMDSRDCIDFT